MTTTTPAATTPTRALPPWRFNLDAIVLDVSPAPCPEVPEVWSWRYVTAAGDTIAASPAPYLDRWDAIAAACRVVGVLPGRLAATITTGGCIVRGNARHGTAASVTMIDPTVPLITYRKAPRRA